MDPFGNKSMLTPFVADLSTEDGLHRWLNHTLNATGRLPFSIGMPWYVRDALLLRLEHHRRFMAPSFPTSHDRFVIRGIEIIESQ